MKSCDDLNVDLLRYLDNDLSEQEVKYLRAHLDTCVYCQDRMQRERALSRFLNESRPLYSAPAELRSQISAAIEEYAARGQSRFGLVVACLSIDFELEDASASRPGDRIVPYGSPEYRAKRWRCELCRDCSNKPQQIPPWRAKRWNPHEVA
jgi:mycothiol system anti-sigma-R factor